MIDVLQTVDTVCCRFRHN